MGALRAPIIDEAFLINELKIGGESSSGLLLTLCASPTGELRKNLRAYGINNHQAGCVSRELADDLENWEVKSINRVLRAAQRDGTTRPSQVADPVETLGDRRIDMSAAIVSSGCLVPN